MYSTSKCFRDRCSPFVSFLCLSVLTRAWYTNKSVQILMHTVIYHHCVQPRVKEAILWGRRMVNALLFEFFLGSSRQFSFQKVVPLLYILNSFLYKSDITHLRKASQELSSYRHSPVSDTAWAVMITGKFMKIKPLETRNKIFPLTYSLLAPIFTLELLQLVEEVKSPWKTTTTTTNL